jgi:hypothetical protein
VKDKKKSLREKDMDANQVLMTAMRKGWGGTIAEACKSSSVPESFLAALIAGESGGHNDAKRFEKGVLAALWEVLLGRKAAYGSIGRADLVGYVTGLQGTPINAPASLPANAFQRVDALATSWGLTQIMGYHVLEFGVTMDSLNNPPAHLTLATKLLAQFAQHFQLDVTQEFGNLFRCWNTGQPDGKTFDPNYVPNGMARMQVYADILANETDPGTGASNAHG